jgi:hypothetical protein
MLTPPNSMSVVAVPMKVISPVVIISATYPPGRGRPRPSVHASRRYRRKLPPVPLSLWRTGPEDSDERWYQLLTIPELAVLLIARSHGDGFALAQPDELGDLGDALKSPACSLGQVPS